MPPESPSKFYLTTPIYYVNARPHIGHAYTTIVADVLARRHRLLGDDVFFLTGTDEHGQKIERSAAAAGIPPQQFADGVSAEFQKLWDRMGLTYNKFIRTTDPAHARGVQKLFRTLYERGFIYLSTYTGAYCVSDEAFVDVPVGEPCSDCGRTTEQVTEENFFFKLSAFQRSLLDVIESGDLAVEPESRRNEVLSFLKGNVIELVAEAIPFHYEDSLETFTGRAVDVLNEGEKNQIVARLVEDASIERRGDGWIRKGALKDLSISRSSFTWGIPVPPQVQQAAGATQSHVIYVWLDALANYMTAIGYGSDLADEQRQFAHYWPADLHLVGKEIIRFHCVYWPAFLLAAELPLPKAITAHGWLLFDNSKMSKSKGNIIRTETILEAFGEHVHGRQFTDSTKRERDLFASDVLRYFLLREIPFGQDGSFSFEALVTRYNADLANGYGNLVSRTLTMINNYFGVHPVTASFGDLQSEEDVRKATVFMQQTFDEELEKNNFKFALELVMDYTAQVDRFLTKEAPWKLHKAGEVERCGAVLNVAANNIRNFTALLYPILPYATARVWAQLGLGDIEAAAANGELKNLQWGGLQPGTKLGPLASIFPRADKGLAQIMNDLENQSSSSLKSSKLAAEQTISELESSEGAARPENGRPDASLKQAFTPTPAAPVRADPNDPAAPPRALDEPAGTLPVAGSSAHTTGPDPTPSHTHAHASGLFASAASQASITAGPADASPQITIDDFGKVELRVAEIKVCERIPKADKLLRLEVDLGHETRQILSGIAEFYAPEELIGRRIVVITNLAPRKMRGLDSHGMLLAASGPEGGKPILATVPEGVPLGSRLK